MKVTRVDRRPRGNGDDDATSSSAGICRCSRTTTARRPIGSSTVSAPSRATTPAIPRAAKSVSTIRRSSTRYIHTLSNGGRIIAGQFDDPYQLDEKGIFDLVNLSHERSRRHPRRAPSAGQGRVHRASTSSRSRSRSRSPTSSRNGIPHNGSCRPNSTDSLLRVWSSISRRQTQTVDADEHHHRPQGLRRLGAGRPQRAAALQRRPRRHAASDALPAHQPAARRDQLRRRHPVPGAGARRRGARHLHGAGRARQRRRHAQRAPRWTSSTPSTWAGRFRSPTASPATSSRSTPPSTRASRTAAVWAAGPRRTAIR